jgi:uncharacterized protein (DUF433 family)
VSPLSHQPSVPGVSTSAIAARIDAGESVDDIAADYDLGLPEIEQAILYERAA